MTDLYGLLKAALYAPASPENEARWAKFMEEFARLTGGEE